MAAIEKGIHCVQDHTQKVFKYIEKRALQLGEKCDAYKDEISPRKQYVCEVLLRVPLLFMIHQWLLVSPYSNYWIIENFLFIVRYTVGFLLTGVWTFNSGVLLQVYISLTIDMALTWMKRITYWTNQDEALELCHDKNVFVWSDVTEHWRAAAILSILVQVVYLCCRPGAFVYRGKKHIFTGIYMALLASLVPDILCVLGVFPSFMSQLSYWIESALLAAVCIIEIGSAIDIDTNVYRTKLKLFIEKHKAVIDVQKKLKYKTKIEDLQQKIKIRKQGGNYVNHLPGKWFIRDTVLAFGVLYLFVVILVEIILYQRQITSISALHSITEILTTWCTSFVFVYFLSCCLGIISNLVVALSNTFLTNKINITEAFDANIGGIVQVPAVITFIEANILSLEYIEKAEAMKTVAFLSLYLIIFQTLNVLEEKILHAVSSGASPGVLFHLRAGILTGLLVVSPTLLTISVSKPLDINAWLLFFASGNCMLIMRTVFMFLECTLVSLTWHTTNHLKELEDLIHYTRLSKSLGLVILNAVQNYCRYICPFFKGWWFLRVCVALFNFVAVAFVLGMEEINRYKARNKTIRLLNNLPDVTFKPTVSNENDDENESNECAICYSVITEGKTLPCNHSFHNDCLRRWFQVKVVCPFCNTEIK